MRLIKVAIPLAALAALAACTDGHGKKQVGHGLATATVRPAVMVGRTAGADKTGV